MSFPQECLRQHVKSLLKEFGERIDELAATSLNQLFVVGDRARGAEALRRFLGSGRFRYGGIDGSLAVEERLEMLLFYVCASAFSGYVEVGEEILVDVSEAEQGASVEVSAAVPLWFEDLHHVSPALARGEWDFRLDRSISNIPNALMTFAELSVAKKLLDDGYRVVVFDGSLSGIFSYTSRDFRRVVGRGWSALEGLETPYGEISFIDVYLAGYFGDGSFYFPPRRRFLRMAVAAELIKEKEKGGEGLRKHELAQKLGVSEDLVEKAIKRVVKTDERFGGKLLEQASMDYLEVRDEVLGYWDRVWSGVEQLYDRFFGGGFDYPFRIGDKWVTTMDVNTLSLFTLFSICSQASRSRALVFGVVKDTSATDVSRSVVDALKIANRLPEEAELRWGKSDRSLLSMYSVVHRKEVSTPWRTLEYDSCFSTITAERREEGVLLRAARRVVGREQLFVRAYFQLRSIGEEGVLRSPVFAYDRPLYPEYDSHHLVELEVSEEGKASALRAYLEDRGRACLGDAVLLLLSLSDNPNVIEALGHNYLLFIADKYVKALAKQARGFLAGVANLEIVPVASRRRAFFISRRFRDLRREIEKVREFVARISG